MRNYMLADNTQRSGISLNLEIEKLKKQGFAHLAFCVNKYIVPQEKRLSEATDTMFSKKMFDNRKEKPCK